MKTIANLSVHLRLCPFCESDYIPRIPLGFIVLSVLFLIFSVRRPFNFHPSSKSPIAQYSFGPLTQNKWAQGNFQHLYKGHPPPKANESNLWIKKGRVFFLFLLLAEAALSVSVLMAYIDLSRPTRFHGYPLRCYTNWNWKTANKLIRFWRSCRSFDGESVARCEPRD